MTRIERNLAWLDEAYDVVVIGGGITGVNVARELAGRGVGVLLVDKGDVGHGTSSATTKYIHGGIRYLESYEFAVVRESLRERRFLTLAAPHLISQRRFLMPAWSWSKPPATLIGAGVGLYTALGFDRNRDVPERYETPLPRWLSKKRLLAAVPWLDPSGLRGAFAYHDTLNIHPERLLLALVNSAVASGARVLTYVEAIGFVTEPVGDGGDVEVTGVELTDRLGGGHHVVRAKAVVNAGGPWMDVVLRALGRDLGVGVRRSKGVHLLTTPIGGTAGEDTVFARARDGRHVIVSPWEGHHFIGPTDTPVDTDPDETRAVADDVAEILGTVNDTIGDPQRRLTVDDVRHVTVGIRPLIVEQGKDSYATSRRHELYDHRKSGVHRLWSIGGGKWTTGRALGVETAEALLESDALDGVAHHPFDSRRVGVVNGFGWAVDPEPFLEASVRGRAELPLDEATRDHLARLYGTDADRVLDLIGADPRLAEPVTARPGCRDIKAQALFAVTDEGAQTLADVVDRRLVLGTLGQVRGDELATVAEVIGPVLGWDATRRAAEVDAELAVREARRALWCQPAAGSTPTVER